MRINKLILKNIGAYFGDYEFDFTTENNKNIILFGGKNGAGKTTILESIRIALFGSFAYGYMSENEPYLNKIKTILSKTAWQNGESSFHVIIHLEQVENYERNSYILTRRWKLRKEKIKEELEVIRDDIHLSVSDVENFQNKIREEIPPQLFELCLFDGEEISRIITENRLSYYLKESGKVLFNLDLYENLEKDLHSFINTEAQKTDSTLEESLLNQIELNVVKLEKQSHEFLEQIEHNNELLNAKKEKLLSIKKDFEVHGGLVKEQRQDLQFQINQIEHERKTNSEAIKKFISGFLPFNITKSLLNKTIEQMDNEKTNDIFEYINTNININDMNKILDDGKDFGLVNSEDTRQILYSGLKTLFQHDNQVTIHRASFRQRSHVQEIANQLHNIDTTNYIDMLDRNNNLLIESSILREKLERNDKASDFKILLADIEKTTQVIEQMNIKLLHLEENYNIISHTINNQKSDREKLLNKLNSSDRSNSSLVISSNIIKISERFREMQLMKKLKLVEIEATKMANQLFQKKQMISLIRINHKTFDLLLFNSDTQEILKERLSAGEKELLMISIIWAMFKCSGRKLPFVFDTLLGRLDKDHKRQLILNFLPTCGEQVIVLSTDSEISNDEFDLMEKHISKQYTLEYNSINSCVDVTSNKYFDIKK
jgi:DNA sulfur modification protein DndD